ncbi:MAG: 1-phosphofructokinase family hexose kinase [Sphingobacteriales bacterium]|nr:1-phosphofructokinase family hexose kinase [Sphingobacteriales bacterium]
MENGTIVTLTMNPAIDKSTSIDKLVPEAKLRCEAIKNEPGGGGINVTRALKKLGTGSLAIFPAGGHNGGLLIDLLEVEKVSFEAIPVRPETRENFIVLETSTNNQFRFGTPGKALDHFVEEHILERLRELKVVPSFIVASGSLPEGISETFYADVAKIAKSFNAKFILDTSGKPLELAANEGVYLLKPNQAELGKLAGRDHVEIHEITEVAQQVIGQGHCEVIVVSMGPDGAYLITKDFSELVPAPVVKKQSTVGAGDSMVAGMVWKLSQGATLSEVVRFGIACGSGATMNLGTELFHVDDVQKIYENLPR